MLNAQETFGAIKATIADAKAEERARIREALISGMRDWLNTVQWRGRGAMDREIGARAALVELQAALDRIAPASEGKEG